MFWKVDNGWVDDFFSMLGIFYLEFMFVFLSKSHFQPQVVFLQFEKPGVDYTVCLKNLKPKQTMTTDPLRL